MMQLEDQARLLFLATLDQVPEQWSSYLDAACGSKTELRSASRNCCGLINPWAAFRWVAPAVSAPRWKRYSLRAAGRSDRPVQAP